MQAVDVFCLLNEYSDVCSDAVAVCINLGGGKYGMKCKDYLGTYKCCEVLKLPWKDRKVDIDNCIVEEIKFLWSQGVKTVESCCGHHMPKAKGGYIAVERDSIEKILKLGYKNKENGPTNAFFKPKSKLKKEDK